MIPGGFFAILDDIALLLDDTATMTKVTTQKTAGILVDDLAVNAEKSSKFSASRELPVLWAITKGSFRNKLIILPVIFLLNYFFPFLIVPILLIGGTYLAFEGAENVKNFLNKKKEVKSNKPKKVLTEEEALKEEKSKVKSAILTDFILSIEIIVIALGMVKEETFLMQLTVVSIVALIATVAVYGIVALLIRLDDLGLWLIKKEFEKTGQILVSLLPKIIKLLAIVGTIAMFLVGGGIYVHNIESLHHVIDPLMPLLVGELLIGLIIGGIVLLIVESFHKVLHLFKK